MDHTLLGRVLCVGLLCLSIPCEAQDQRLVFQPPRDVVIQMPGSAIVRGRLLSVDRVSTVVELPANSLSDAARTVRLSTPQIQSLRTVDGAFEFRAPADPEKVKASVVGLPGVSVETVTISPDASEPSDDSESDSPIDASPQPGASTPVGIPAFIPGDEAPLIGPPTNPAPASGPRELPIGTKIICENCGKEVAITSQYGQKCPHCGIRWEFEVVPPQTAAPSAPSGFTPLAPSIDSTPQKADKPVGGPTEEPRRLDVPPPPPGPAAEPMDFASVPVWMKAALFLGAIGLCYYVVFYRR